MIRRILHAAAALGVTAALVVLPGSPAHAAPSGDLCSVKEWQNPANFSTCASKLQSNIGEIVDCRTPPSPDSPDAGVGGMVTRRPDADLQSGPTGMYTQYGVAGYLTTTYDLGCAGMIRHPDAEFETTMANGEMMAASGIVGASNGLRELAYNPSKAWGWSDDLVKTLSDQGFGWLFFPLAPLAVLAVGIYLMWRAPRGDMSNTAHTVGWMMLVTVGVIVVARFPLQTTHTADQYGTTALATIQQALGSPPQDLPPGLCAELGTHLDGDPCHDHRTTADRSADTVTEAILYRQWLAIEFGDANSPTAQKYGAALYDAGTLTWDEADGLRKSPQEQKDVFDRKAQQWMKIAAQVRQDDPVAYDHLRGLHGWSRVVDGFVALLASLVFAAFDLTASLIILVGFAVVRFAVVVLPVLGAVAIFRPASGDLRRVFHATVGSLLNIAVFGALAALFLRFTDAIFSSGLNSLMQIVAVLVAAVALWLWLRPWRRVTGLVGHHGTSGGDVDGNGRGGRLIGRIRRLNRATTTPPVDSPTAPAPADAPVSPACPPTRPEAQAPPSRPASPRTTPPAASRPDAPTTTVPAATRPEALTRS